MSDQIVLEASKREVIGKQVKQLRREGKLPAVLSGLVSMPLPSLWICEKHPRPSGM